MRLLQSLSLALVAGALIACSTGAPTPSGERKESKESIGHTSSAIINGLLDTAHPAVVALIGSQGGLCTGTIVKTDTRRHIGWVVTAAHCVKVAPTLVVQSEDLRSPTAIRYEVIDFRADPRWAGETESPYDFAVVRIAGVDETTPVIPLGGASDALEGGSVVKSVGFGRTTLISAMGPDKNSLRRAIDETLDGVSETHLRYDMSNQGICQGDSGGPVLAGSGTADEQVVGVHSYVSGDCNGEGFSGRVALAFGSFFAPELDTALPPDSCSLCEKIANSGLNECAALSASCLADPNCKGYYECLSSRTKAACIKQYPLAEGPLYAASKCLCERSCKDSCYGDDTCNVPKCGVANERNNCSTCLESLCCSEETDCAANGQCYVCLKNNDVDPTCATNGPRKALAACAASRCTTQCAGMSILNNIVPIENDLLPTGEPEPSVRYVGETYQCSTSVTGASSGGCSSAILTLALGWLLARRRRSPTCDARVGSHFVRSQRNRSTSFRSCSRATNTRQTASN